jgi:surface polysaccharide O-acyltransferase-like enzyme
MKMQDTKDLSNSPIKNRTSNIELLRIVLILMIITHHILYHGLGLFVNNNSEQLNHPTIYFKLFIESFIVIAVNAFIFISGFYGMKFKIRSILDILLQAVFYSVGIYILYYFYDHSIWSSRSFLLAFFPISTGVWWFITAYFCLMFFAPFINSGFESLKKEQIKIILIGFLLIDCFSGFLLNSVISGHGYTLFHFITIYILARYIKTYQTDYKNALLLLTASTLLIFSIAILLLHMGKYNTLALLFSHNNPLIIFSAIMLFFTFKKLNFQSKFVNLIATSVLGIYFIHDHFYFRVMIKEISLEIQKDLLGIEPILMYILMVSFIFSFCSGIELSRKYFHDNIMNKLKVQFDSSFK